MVGIITKAAAALGVAMIVSFAISAPSLAGPEAVATFASLGPDTSVPFGWVDFCQRYAGECGRNRVPEDIELTAAAMRKIQRVNAFVNKMVEPVSDMDHWGVVDQWDYPTDGKGDCEDFALLKRRMLIEEGFPRSALLMTVVKEKNGDGHAVLTIKTSRGEFILDNLNDSIKPWNSTNYRFVKRQSQLDPNVWVAVGAPTSEPLYVSK